MWKTKEFTDIPDELIKEKDNVEIDKKTIKLKVSF